MAKSVTHTVKKGDTLEKIAKKYGIAKYQTIYDDPANAKLKKARPNADEIQPGDKVVIPAQSDGPGPKQLKSMLASLEAQVADRQKTQKNLEKNLTDLKARFAKAKAKYKKNMTAVEVAETMAFITTDITKVVANTAKVGKGTMTLAKANSKNLKAVGSAWGRAIDPAQKAAANKLQAQENAFLKFGGIGMNAFMNLTTPSFYGSRLAVLQGDGFFKKVLSGKFEGTKEDLLKAYNWDFGKELDDTYKRIETETRKAIDSFKKMDAADKDLIKEIRAQLK